MNALEYLFGLEQFGIKFGLEHIRALVERLGHPELSFHSVHIAGTNGKGSVTAMVDTGLRAAGHRTARYTSPHLVNLNERFVIGGEPIGDEPLSRAIDDVRAVVEQLRADGVLDVHPTFFEVTTAAAFELFRRAAVEVAVVEVGLGGRLDATNVLVPDVTAITTISFDHQQYLGATLREIALEKAGIIKAGVPLVLGELETSAAEAIEQVAREKRSPIVRARAGDLGSRAVRLSGEHQRRNAAVALRILEILNARGITVSGDAIETALAGTEWPGRLDRRRLADGRELLMDAAHNPAGAEALATYLHAQGIDRPVLVFAAMRDKDVAGMFRLLLPTTGSLVLTRAANPRSADPEELARIAREIARDLPLLTTSSVDAALDEAWRRSRSRPIVVAGSVFLLGDVMKLLGLH